MDSIEITKEIVFETILVLHEAAKNHHHHLLISGEPPDSAYNIREFLGTGDLETIDLYRDEILTEMCKSIRCRQTKIPVNPKLPKIFDVYKNEDRPKSHYRWWYRPFITTDSWQNKDRYFVQCLDGGAWDRSTFHGVFSTLEEALNAAKKLAEIYEPYRRYCRLLYPARLSGGFHIKLEYPRLKAAYGEDKGHS